MDYSSTEHNITWFRDRYRDGELEIKPPYQRNPVWADRQRSSFIESILLSLPIPEVFIQESTTSEGDAQFYVVDGQQRIRTILLFLGAEGDPDLEEHNSFALDKLDAQSRWAGLTFNDLSEDEARAFFRYRVAVRVLETDSDDEIRDMFRRLNRYLTPLNAQELRNAMYKGPFMRLAIRLANDEYWSEARVVSPQGIRRMADVQLASELLIGAMHGPQGGSQAVVDDYYAQYEDYESEFPNQRRAQRAFVTVRDLIQDLFPDIRSSRWSNLSDFYSLFVALAHFQRTRKLEDDRKDELRQALVRFAERVEALQADPNVRASKQAKAYTAAVQRGANDKARRADRHKALTETISRYFSR
jgi:hypothetical protein